MSTLMKMCRRCKIEKTWDEFYIRSGHTVATEEGHLNSECKSCIKERSKSTGTIHPTVPRANTELIAIEMLNKNGIACLPGKAVHASDVDVVAWGHVRIEVKYANLEWHRGRMSFSFVTTPKQVERGFLADIVMLICDYGDKRTYHLFDATHEVFYIYGRVKTGFVFTPGQMEQVKHMNNRVKLTQPIMDAHENNWSLVWKYVKKISYALKRGESPNQI